MPKESFVILGISPGSKYLGVSVFYGPELREWRTKAIKGKWSLKKLNRILDIISDLIERHQPDALAVKRLHPSRSSPGLGRLTDQVMSLAQKKGIRIYQFGIKEMERHLLREGKTSKRKLAEAVAAAYPVLYHELELEHKNRNAYHIRMFEAVALGAVCFHKLDNK